MIVPNLRSAYEKVGGIHYFPRMLDKIRLQAQGKLPEDYVPNLGGGFDGRCCSFLQIDYPALAEFVKGGATDEAALEWAFQHGRKPSEEEIEIWNEFMRKRGWNDDGTPTLQRRLREGNFDRQDVQTFFDYIEVDEGREPRGSGGA
jgi:gluconokinase